MPALKTFANLWTLWDHPSAGAGEWSLPQKVAAVAAAGFDGVMGEPGAGLGALAAERGLAFCAFRRLDGGHDFDAELAAAKAEGARVLQVHLGWHDTGAEEALRWSLALMAAGERAGVPVVVETHRDTCTETPEKTEALRRAFRAASGRELPLLLDFSHPALVKHLVPPYAPRLLADRELVRGCGWHHLRPFNGQHAQIPVLAAGGGEAPEMGDWWPLAEEILAILRTSKLPEVWVSPELGPVRGGYGLSCFASSWAQAVALRAELVRRWGR